MIIREPFEYPIAANHLAVLVIQKHVRGRQTRHGFPNAKIAPLFNEKQKAPVVAEKKRYNDESFECIYQSASRIQAWWKMLPICRTYRLHRFPIYHLAIIDIQFAFRSFLQLNNSPVTCVAEPLEPSTAIFRIQRFWRRTLDRRVFTYYKDLISFRASGDPSILLRSINPHEASLIDAASGAHVRFRLGGYTFPPSLYYKVFLHGAVCDVNAFSPKDYRQERRCDKRSSKLSNNKKTKDFRQNQLFQADKKSNIRVGNSTFSVNQKSTRTKEWYTRLENNGWRPVSVKVLSEAEMDPVNIATRNTNAMLSKFYGNVHSLQAQAKTRRQNKRNLMLKLYR